MNYFLKRNFKNLHFNKSFIKINKFYFSAKQKSFNEKTENIKIENNNSLISPVARKQFNKLALFVYFPVVYHTVETMVDVFLLGKFYPHIIETAIREIFLLNAFNAGIVFGLRLEKEQLSDPPLPSYNEIYYKLGFATASYILSNILTSYSLAVPLFIPIYLTFGALSILILKTNIPYYNFYSKNSIKLLVVILVSFLLIILLNYKQYQESMQNKKKFEDVVKFFEISTDGQFKKVMNEYEKYLDEIQFKFEKEKTKTDI